MPLTENDIERIGDIVKLKCNEAVGPIKERLVAGDKDFDAINNRLDDHQVVLYGSPDSEKPGLIESVGDLKKGRATGSKFFWAILGSILTVGGGLLAKLVFKN